MSDELNGNIPPRFVAATFETYHPANQDAESNLKICREYADTWLSRKTAGEGLILCGTPGTGKTHLAVSIARQVATEAKAIRD